MKKERIVFKKLDKTETNLSLIVALHQSIFTGTAFENNLIYYDPNFEDYLNQILDSKNHYFYVVEFDENIQGFIHIRYINDFLFLNNIAINKDFKRLSLGKGLIKFALNDVVTVYGKETKFKLDVFESNKIALNWYQNLGFQLESSKKWYSLQKRPSASFCAELNTIEKRKDANGFVSLFNISDKVATLIFDNLVLHKSNSISKIDLSKYKNIISDDDSFLQLSDLIDLLYYTQIDESIRMYNSLESVVKKLT